MLIVTSTCSNRAISVHCHWINCGSWGRTSHLIRRRSWSISSPWVALKVWILVPWRGRSLSLMSLIFRAHIIKSILADCRVPLKARRAACVRWINNPSSIVYNFICIIRTASNTWSWNDHIIFVRFKLHRPTFAIYLFVEVKRSRVSSWVQILWLWIRSLVMVIIIVLMITVLMWGEIHTIEA